MRAWSEACPALREQCARAEACVPGRVVLSLGCDAHGSRERVELSDGPSGFRRAGSAWASPVGDFADWSAAPASTRAALDAVVSCAEQHGDRPRASSALRRSSSTPTRWAFAAWRLWAALLCVVALAALSSRPPPGSVSGRPSPRAVALQALTGLGIVLATLALRRLLAGPGGFFHQNGQGPSWVAPAVALDGALSVYGPGQWELFHAITSVFPNDPDGALFSFASLLSALAVGCVFFSARMLGAARPLAGVLTAGVALMPIAARVAGSESYYGSGASLLAFAGALLLAGGRAPELRDGPLRLAVATVGAGLFVAQAARLHPVVWVPAALVPSVLLAGQARGRARRAAWSALGVGAVVTLSTGSELLSVLRGPLGAKWAPAAARFAGASWTSVFLSFSLGALGLSLAAGLAISARRERRRVDRASGVPGWSERSHARDLAGTILLYALLFALWRFTRPVRGEGGTYDRPYALLWALPLTAALAGVGVSFRHRAYPPLIALALALAAAFTAREDLTRPTDALETDEARAWRARLPPHSIVYYPARGPTHVLHLPLYGTGEPTDPRPEGRPLEGDQPAPAALDQASRPTYFYASGLCSTLEARALCEDLPRRYELTRVHTSTLPARPSGSVTPYAAPVVPITLSRFTRAR